jgi:hypothetical protein
MVYFKCRKFLLFQHSIDVQAVIHPALKPVVIPLSAGAALPLRKEVSL